MVGLRRGLGTGAGREARRLLAEVAPVRRPGGADRFAQGLGSEMAIALLDRDRIGVDDEIIRLVPFGPRERLGRRWRIGQHCGAVEILAPRLVDGLKDDDAVGQTIGGDHIGHLALTAPALGASWTNVVAYLTTAIYVFVFRTITKSCYEIADVCRFRASTRESKPAATKSKCLSLSANPSFSTGYLRIRRAPHPGSRLLGSPGLPRRGIRS